MRNNPQLIIWQNVLKIKQEGMDKMVNEITKQEINSDGNVVSAVVNKLESKDIKDIVVKTIDAVVILGLVFFLSGSDFSISEGNFRLVSGM